MRVMQVDGSRIKLSGVCLVPARSDFLVLRLKVSFGAVGWLGEERVASAASRAVPGPLAVQPGTGVVGT